jgi:hypothetical protein
MILYSIIGTACMCTVVSYEIFFEIKWSANHHAGQMLISYSINHASEYAQHISAVFPRLNAGLDIICSQQIRMQFPTFPTADSAVSIKTKAGT